MTDLEIKAEARKYAANPPEGDSDDCGGGAYPEKAFEAGAKWVAERYEIEIERNKKILELCKESYDAEMKWVRKGVQGKSEWAEEYEQAMSIQSGKRTDNE